MRRTLYGREVPDSLRDILLAHPWDLSKLLALALPDEEVSVTTLAWQLDLPWWRVGDDPAASPENDGKRVIDPMSAAAVWATTDGEMFDSYVAA